MASSVASSSQFGLQLRLRRKALGITQADLADVIGVNRRVLGELENGKATVQLGIALRAAEALGLGVQLDERR